MTRSHDPLIERVRTADPLRGDNYDHPHDLETLRCGRTPDAQPPGKAPRTSRWGRSAFALGVSAAVLAGGAAAAGGLLAGPSPQEAGIVCVQTADQISAIPSLTDSPTQDCVDEWRRVSAAVPDDLVMYQPTGMLVHVAPRPLVPPSTPILTTIPAGEVLDREVKAILEDRFNNAVTEQRCASTTDTRSYLKSALNRTSATDVRVEEEGIGTCTTTEYDAASNTVVLHRSFPRPPFASGAQPHPEPLTPAMETLKTSLSHACAADDVDQAIDRYAQDEGVPLHDMTIGRHDGAGGACTRAYLIPSGSIHLEVFRP